MATPSEDRIEVIVNGNRFQVVLQNGEPVGIAVPGHDEGEEIGWGEALLSRAEQDQVYAAALEKLHRGTETGRRS